MPFVTLLLATLGVAGHWAGSPTSTAFHDRTEWDWEDHPSFSGMQRGQSDGGLASVLFFFLTDGNTNDDPPWPIQLASVVRPRQLSQWL